MIRETLAPAKVNLYLHVGPVQGDGYHPVESLMVFADVGDVVSLHSGETGFSLEGPFAGALGTEDDNLVTRARNRFIDVCGGGSPGFRLRKQLPVAAGLGGGSSDAAATLRLLASHRGLASDDSRLMEIAQELGADVSACLDATPTVGRGRGDQLSPAPALPKLPAVLVNPGVPSPTGAVYRAFDSSGALGPLAAVEPGELRTVGEVAAWLSRTRNDLEPAAIGLTPAIGQALRELSEATESLFTRMSGSGATVFALCAGSGEAAALADRLAQRHPGWWIRSCLLGAPL